MSDRIRRSAADLIPLRRLHGDTSDMSDEALVAACAVGEPAALGGLYDRHHRSVFRFLARLAPASDQDLDDMVQTTFIELWRSAGRFRGHGTARSWILGIAANVARHYRRGEQRRRIALEEMADCSTATSARPDEQAAQRELLDRLGIALANLSHDLRVAFVMCDLEGIPGVEAARVLKVRQGTMWRRLHTARKTLRGALEGRSA